MNLKSTAFGAIAVFLASAGAAAAYPATVTTNLNVRSGPGTNYGVIDSLPAGSVVDIAGCTGNWCEVAGLGWASASYLATGGNYAVAPAYVTRPAVSFYIGSLPYYWHDDGYYWYYRDGRRHRVHRNFFDSHRNIRWHSDRDRRRWEQWHRSPPRRQQVRPDRPPRQQFRPGQPPRQQVQPNRPPRQQAQPNRPPRQQAQPNRPPRQQARPNRPQRQQAQPDRRNNRVERSNRNNPRNTSDRGGRFTPNR